MDGHAPFQLSLSPLQTPPPTASAATTDAFVVQVTVVDISEKQIGAWNSDNLPIFEPGLLEVRISTEQLAVHAFLAN